MDHLQLGDVAERIGISVETVRSYGQRFALYVPAVRDGAQLCYTAEGATLLAEIHQSVEAGATFEEIEAALQAYLPVTIVAHAETTPERRDTADALQAMRQALDDQQTAFQTELAALRAQIATLVTGDQFHSLRAETASLAAILTQRDIHLEHAAGVLAAELRESLANLRDQFDSLDAELQEDRVVWRGVLELIEGGAFHHDATGEKAEHLPGAGQRRTTSRTPRRMGQPLRSHGLPQS